jgi:uncharacterized iron-regulated membrane protein
VNSGETLTVWQRWAKRPQKIWLRRAVFQLHLWSGIGLGLYIFFISVTGSVLVYRNELYRAATPDPIVSTGPGPRLTDAELTAAALRAYPGYTVRRINRLSDPDQAVDVGLARGKELKARLFDVRSGVDLGDSVPMGVRLVSGLLDLHDNLMAGPTGRLVNGVGGMALIAVAVTGLVVWWPGSKTWRRSLILPRGVGFKRGTWHLHSMIGIWTLAFTLIFGLSAVYLCYPTPFDALADWIQPPTAANGGTRIVDKIIYWLAYLHFGRILGIGIPCSGPGVCDQATKASWAFFGLAPAAMFVSGAMMWWNRVLRPRRAGTRRADRKPEAMVKS